MRTREFINKYCKYCKDFEPGLGCGVQWADEVCSNAICENDYNRKDIVDRIAEYFDKIEEKKHPRKQTETKKDKIELTESQLGNHIRFPQPKFAYVIYVYDEDDDIKNVWVDSIWTNENEALQRLKVLEASENAIIELSDKKYQYTYKLRGLTRNFQWPDGCVIRRENKDGTVYDDKYLIVCERAALNDKDFLKPFSTDKFKELVNKVKGK